jgi:GWxTD domain-containing protein
MIAAITHTLFHSIWEGSAIAILLALVLYVLRPFSARVRYALACVAMLTMLAAFGATLAWFWPHDPALIVRTAAPRSLPVRFSLSYNALMTPATPRPLQNWVAPLWMLGVLLFSLRSFAAWLAAMRLRRTAVTAASAEWQAVIQRLGERLRVSPPVTLLQSCLTDIPVVIGFLKPAILVPASLFTGFPPEHLEFILLHELAHIRRHDYLVNLLQSLAEDLLFYHPAVWWVSTVIRTERENCCDDVVVATQGDALGFAEALASLEQQRWSAYDAALAANGGHLMNRIRRLLNLGPDRPRFAAAPAFSASLLVAALALVSVTHAQPSPAPEAPAPPSAQQAPAAPQAAAPQPPAQTAPETIARPETEQQKKNDEAKLKRELETPYKKWLNEEVFWVITAEERKEFQGLAADDQREQFIEDFWKRRDPTPSTDENEYREEYYRRIAYANENFSSGIPGWKTDRGMIYIKYGPPNEREQHPSGGAYQRPIEDGGGTTATFPFERWRYRYIDGLGNDVNIEFVDTTGNGEYHLTTDPAEKDKLLSLPNTPLTPEILDRFKRLQSPRAAQNPGPFQNLPQAVPAPPKPKVPPEDAIEEVVFEGARRMPQDLLRNMILSHRGDKLDSTTVDQDVKALWNTQRFDDIAVGYARGKVGWIVTFMVVERPVPPR